MQGQIRANKYAALVSQGAVLYPSEIQRVARITTDSTIDKYTAVRNTAQLCRRRPRTLDLPESAGAGSTAASTVASTDACMPSARACAASPRSGLPMCQSERVHQIAHRTAPPCAHLHSVSHSASRLEPRPTPLPPAPRSAGRAESNRIHIHTASAPRQ